MNFIPTSQFDAKLFLLTNKMWLKVNHMLAPFWIVYMSLIFKSTHDVGFNVWPQIQGFIYYEQLCGKRYGCNNKAWFWNPNSFLCSIYPEMNAFTKPTKTFVTLKWPFVVFGARLSPNDILIEHVIFYIHNSWFMYSKWKLFSFWISIIIFSVIISSFYFLNLVFSFIIHSL